MTIGAFIKIIEFNLKQVDNYFGLRAKINLARKSAVVRLNYSDITRRLSTLLCAESVYQFSQTERRDLTSDTNYDQICALSN